MAKVVATYQSLDAAQHALRQLGASGIDAAHLSVNGAEKNGLLLAARWKPALCWGSALGAAATLLPSNGAQLFFSGHQARGAALHALSIVVRGVVTGAAASGTLSLLWRAGADRRAQRQTIKAPEQFTVAVGGEWLDVQRARAVLGLEQPPEPRLVELVRRYGYEHQSFLSLYGGMQAWYARGIEGAVSYQLVGRVAVVAAAPLAARADLGVVTRQFLDYCAAREWDCLMLPVGAEFAQVAHACGMGLLPIGESGYFRLPAWQPTGDRAKKVRAGVNQARKAGLGVEEYDPVTAPTVRAEIEELCQAWVNTREIDALGWLLELAPFRLSEHKRYFLARDAAGRLVGMLTAAPIYARCGWYLEDLIRGPGAGRGVSELLVVEALRRLAATGAKLATLGTSPLAGGAAATQFKMLARALRFIYHHLDAFYHFKTLHRFKAKFAPSYVEPEYLAIYPPRVRLRMVRAVIGALEPTGLSGVITSKLRRWRRAAQPSSVS